MDKLIVNSIGFFFLITAPLLLKSCATVSEANRTPLGIQDAYQSYVPAKIAVLPSRKWPQTAPLALDITSNIDQDSLDKILQSINSFIVNSFSNQPYMNGYTPTLVDSLMTKAGNKGYMSDIDTLWQTTVSEDCSVCHDPLLFYQQIIANREAWLMWLHQLSQHTKFSDAALVPFLTIVHEEQRETKGLLESTRSLKLILMLIDTNNAKLIWTGMNQASLSNKSIPSNNQTSPPFPSWSILEKNLLIEHIWHQFPGRITY